MGLAKARLAAQIHELSGPTILDEWSAIRKLSRNGVLGDHDYNKSGITFLTVLLEDDGFEACRSRGAALQDNPTPDRYLIKVAVMTVTTVGGVKNTRKPYPLQFEIGCDLNKGIFNYSNHQESSSKTQIASCLLMILCCGGEGGIRTPVRVFIP